MSQITYVGQNYTDNSVTFAIDGDRYEYFFRAGQTCDDISYMAKRWPGKALALAKRTCMHWEKHIERV